MSLPNVIVMPGDGAVNPLTIPGTARQYRCAIGSAISVPGDDGHTLCSLGWVSSAFPNQQNAGSAPSSGASAQRPPGLAQGQIYSDTTLGTTIIWGGPNTGWLNAQTGASVAAGGGGTPSWVPANAKIAIDLVGGAPQGRAWSGGAAVAVNTLLGADPNTTGGWNASAYSSANLTANGYVDASGATVPAFIGAALTKVLAGATIVVQLKTIVDPIVSGHGNSTPFVALDAAGGHAVEVDMDAGGGLPNKAAASSWTGPLSLTDASAINTGLNALNRIAITLTATRCEFSANGRTALAGAITSADVPAASPLACALVDPNVNRAIQSITLYDPLPSTTGLSALSVPA